MIITLVKADFSANNIGMIDAWMINRALGIGASYNGVNTIAKDGSLNATITLSNGYELAAAGVVVTMGGIVVSDAATVDGSTITVMIEKVTGNILITVPTVSNDIVDDVVTGITIVTGYYDNQIFNSNLATRARIDGLITGPFSLVLKDGYNIRAIYEYDTPNLLYPGNAIVTKEQLLTEYTGGQEGKYYGVTICKTNAEAEISPAEESMVKSFSGTIVAIDNSVYKETTVPGAAVEYTLRNGAHVDAPSIFEAKNRVCTATRIKGAFTVTVNDGYAIRAVYEYPDTTSKSSGFPANTSTDRTTFTSTNPNAYYGVTFTYAGGNANNDISPNEDIVASWVYV